MLLIRLYFFVIMSVELCNCDNNLQIYEIILIWQKGFAFCVIRFANLVLGINRTDRFYQNFWSLRIIQVMHGFSMEDFE